MFMDELIIAVTVDIINCLLMTLGSVNIERGEFWGSFMVIGFFDKDSGS